MCPRERFPLYKSLSRLFLCYKKDWATLLHLIYFHCLLPVTNYLITKLSVTDNFSACGEYLTEKPLVISLCSSLGSTLLLIERTTIDHLHLWVIRRIIGHSTFREPLPSPSSVLKPYRELGRLLSNRIVLRCPLHARLNTPPRLHLCLITGF